MPVSVKVATHEASPGVWLLISESLGVTSLSVLRYGLQSDLQIRTDTFLGLLRQAGVIPPENPWSWVEQATSHAIDRSRDEDLRPRALLIRLLEHMLADAKEALERRRQQGGAE